MAKSDFVVLVGTGLAMMTRRALGDWDPARAGAVNIDLGEIERSDLAGTTVRGDIGEVFRLLERLRTQRPFTAPPVAYYELTRFVARPAVPVPGRTGGTGEDALLQSEAVRLLQEHLPQGGHLLYDAGNCAVAAMHYGSVPASSSTIALGMGGMGYSVGAAVGAQLGSPEGTRTVVFCGDGAFLMSGLETHTAVELGLPILYVVFNNGMHGMCATRQQRFFDSRITTVDYTPVDVCTVARGLGSPTGCGSAVPGPPPSWPGGWRSTGATRICPGSSNSGSPWRRSRPSPPSCPPTPPPCRCPGNDRPPSPAR
ncbi:thiamine pyrophosphate-dependent enzyme [Streptomyces nogalater]